MVHNMGNKDEQEPETDIETVNINSVRFNYNCFAIIANLKTSSNKVVITVPYNMQ